MSQVDEVLELERELQTLRCRRDAARLRTLLADDFTEVGASGRIWDRASIIEHIGAEDGEEIEVLRLAGRVAGADVILTQWDSRRGRDMARRTSLWRRTGEGWQIVHHQGTPLTIEGGQVLRVPSDGR